MHRIFQTFIDSLLESADASAFETAMSRAATALGFRRGAVDLDVDQSTLNCRLGLKKDFGVKLFERSRGSSLHEARDCQLSYPK
jgi:hypothetical protein